MQAEEMSIVADLSFLIVSLIFIPPFFSTLDSFEAKANAYKRFQFVSFNPKKINM